MHTHTICSAGSSDTFAQADEREMTQNPFRQLTGTRRSIRDHIHTNTAPALYNIMPAENNTHTQYQAISSSSALYLTAEWLGFHLRRLCKIYDVPLGGAVQKAKKATRLN